MPDSDKPVERFFDCAQNDSSIVTLNVVKGLPMPASDKPARRFFASLRMTKRTLRMTVVLSP